MRKTGMKSLSQVKADIDSFLRGKDIETLIVSCEHFSYFREKKEIERLTSNFPLGIEIAVFLVVRDLEDYRISYREHVKTTGHGESDDLESPYYLKEDSWLLDDEALIKCRKSQFKNFTLINYEQKGMVRKLAETMQLPHRTLTKEYQLNTNSPFLKRLKKLIRNLIKTTSFGRTCLRKYRKKIWG